MDAPNTEPDREQLRKRLDEWFYGIDVGVNLVMAAFFGALVLTGVSNVVLFWLMITLMVSSAVVSIIASGKRLALKTRPTWMHIGSLALVAVATMATGLLVPGFGLFGILMGLLITFRIYRMIRLRQSEAKRDK